ncbi:MAG TPA: hypothetical protein VEJ63_06090 [Planctomycetota bacterium]|nr:hypothetical protein [Planctomycetota bacterium]
MQELNESSDFPAHLLAPESHYQPRPWRPLWFLPIGRLILIALILTPVYLILNRIALFVPWVLPLFSQPVWTIIGGILVLYTLEILFRWWHAARQWNDVERRARALMNAGELAEPGRILDDFCRRARSWRLYHAMAVLLRAEVYLRENRGDRAFGLLAAVQNSHFFEDRKHRRKKAELQNLIGLSFGAQNDIEAAEQWLGLAHDSVPPQDAALLLPLQMAIAIRRSRHAVVLRDVEAEWPQAQARLDPHMLAALAALCAMASRRLDAPADAVREAKTAEWLSLARKSGTPLDWLAVGWPDMKEFLRVQGLISARESRLS